MAKASFIKEQTEVVVTQEAGIQLDLSIDEAKILSDILGAFMGGGLTSPIYYPLVEELESRRISRGEGIVHIDDGNGARDLGDDVLVYKPDRNAW